MADRCSTENWLLGEVIVMIPGDDGITTFIHRFIPSPTGEASRTLLLLHGTGGSESDLLDLGRLLAPDAALLSPRGKVLENGTSRFFRRLAEGIFDIADLTRRTYELADFIEAASIAYDFDPRQITAVGYSNGANIAASMLLLRPRALSAAILLHPMVPFVPDVLPDLLNKPIFIGAGQADPLVPVSETERLAHLLRRAGATVSTHWHNGAHAISHEEVREARIWLKQLARTE
jgi:phospholipase/carboxylesterase